MFNTFKTKRFGYHKALEMLDQTNALAIIGQRYIGKTTILQQIKELYGDRAIYIDLSEYPDKDCLDNIFDMCTDKTEVILLDEVTKYEINHVVDIVKNILMHQIKCIYTGKNPYILREYFNAIDEGISLELSPITYGEWLCWKNGNKLDNIKNYSTEVLKYSTNEQFMQFLNEPSEIEGLRRLDESSDKTRDSLLVENLLRYYLTFIKSWNVGKYKDFYKRKFNIVYNIVKEHRLYVLEVNSLLYRELFEGNYIDKYTKQADDIYATLEVLTYSYDEKDIPCNIDEIKNNFYNYKVIPNHILALLIEKSILEGTSTDYDSTLSELISNGIDEIANQKQPAETIELSSIDF